MYIYLPFSDIVGVGKVDGRINANDQDSGNFGSIWIL